MKRILLLATIFLFPACGGIPPTHYYVLEWQAADTDPRPAPTRPGISVGVEVFRVEPPYDQDRIVYRADPGTPERGFYAYHRWAAPVSRMLPQMTADGLRGMAGVIDIGPVVPGIDYDALLTGTVFALVEVDTAEGHEARVRLRLDLRRRTGELLWGEEMERVVITRQGSVESIVEAMNAALSDLVRDARPRIEAAIGSNDFPAEPQ